MKIEDNLSEYLYNFNFRMGEICLNKIGKLEDIKIDKIWLDEN